MNEQPWWRDRPAARPLPVKGGIKARDKRGVIGRTWWSGRFIEVLESMGLGGRLSRGRTYARAGQVISLEVAPGSVRAQVQGSRPRPYQARIGGVTFGKAEWGRVERAMAESAWYAAKLLAGEMPPDIEDLFNSLDLALFPGARELSMDCSCPDYQVPCKHLAAVCYLLAESFDEDPFGILALRGRDRETLLDNLRARRGSSGPDTEPGELAGSLVPVLADCLDSYFQPAAELPKLSGATAPVDAVLDELPAVSLVVRGRPLVELLRPAYQALGEPVEGKPVGHAPGPLSGRC